MNTFTVADTVAAPNTRNVDAAVSITVSCEDDTPAMVVANLMKDALITALSQLDEIAHPDVPTREDTPE